MEQITEMPMAFRRVRMSDAEQNAALRAYSLRSATDTAKIAPTKTVTKAVAIASPSKATLPRTKDTNLKPIQKAKGQPTSRTKAKTSKGSGQPKKVKVARTLSLDADVLAFFAAGGRGASSRINAILRSVVDAVAMNSMQTA
jgi:uncharacterized protein (DUF4415 family)